MTQLKNTYTSREVAELTGLTARQLQWWDDKRLFAAHIAPKKTARGGYTERRYTPVDLLEFFYLTPLPGSEDHQKLFRAGAWMDPDLNKYDVDHRGNLKAHVAIFGTYGAAHILVSRVGG